MARANSLYVVYVSALILTAAMWGFGFIATKWVLVFYGPHWANTIRFFIAAFVSTPFLVLTFRKGFRHAIPGLAVGIFLFLGMLFQTIGLEYTTVAKSGFFTSLYVLIIPVTMMTFFRQKYTWNFWLFLLLALLGIALLCNLSFDGFNIGDFYTLLCAFSFAGHIITIGKITHRYTAFELNALQMLSATLLGLSSSYFLEGPVRWEGIFNKNMWQIDSVLSGFLFLGIGSSFLAFAMQNLAQKYMTTHVAGMVLLMESPFGTLFAFLILKEYLSPQQILGCVLVLIAVLGVSVFSKRVRKMKRKKVKRFRIPFGKRDLSS